VHSLAVPRAGDDGTPARGSRNIRESVPGGWPQKFVGVAVPHSRAGLWQGAAARPVCRLRHGLADTGTDVCPVPLGAVTFEHLLEPAAAGCVRVVKRAH